MIIPVITAAAGTATTGLRENTEAIPRKHSILSV